MNHTYTEIVRQPADWTETLELVLAREEELRAFFAEERPNAITFTGCGTSYYLAMSAASLFQEETGIPCRALPASEIMTDADRALVRSAGQLLVAFSRSGSTTETLEAMKVFSAGGYGRVLAFTCRSASPADEAARLTIGLSHAGEHSLVMTTSFTNMLLASQLVSVVLTGNTVRRTALGRLPALAAAGMEASDRLAHALGSDKAIDRYIYLGLSACYGAASEAVLKMKEMTQTPTEAYNPFEFRHGPISIVDGRTLCVLLASDPCAAKQAEVLRDIRKLGGRTLFVGDEAPFDTHADHALLFGTKLTDWERLLLYMPFVQLMGNYRALSLGLDPDNPRYLNPVVYL